MLGKAKEILAKHQAQNQITLTETKAFLIEKRPHDKEVSFKEHTFLEGLASLAFSSEKLKAIRAQFQESQIEAEIQAKIEIGASFPDYGEIDNVLDEGKTVLKHTPGQVLLVDVWATWCGPCQKPMQHNQEILVQHEHLWGDKVKIVAVSVDEEKEGVKERINSKGWTKITHLTLNKWDGDHKLIQNFAIQGIPFVCLVDKFGKINYTGHPSTIKLQDRINELLKAELEEKKEIVAPSAKLDQKSIEGIQQICSKENIEKRFGQADLFCLKGKIKSVFSKNTVTCEGEITISTFEGDDHWMTSAKALFADVPEIKIIQNFIKFVAVPQSPNPQCMICKSPLAFPYYWLRFEVGDHFGCRKCIEQTNGKRYKYENNSVLLRAPWEKIALKSLGVNAQHQDKEAETKKHQYGCNGGCGQAVLQGPRNICLACRADPNPFGDYIDCCSPCLDSYINGDEGKKTALNTEGHTAEHPFLRILYNVNGYYNF